MSSDSSSYRALGGSSSKEGVLAAVGESGPRNLFCSIIDDPSGNPDYAAALHADGVGTKSITAYIAFRESGDPAVFRSLAQDSLVMNLDDIACVNLLESLVLSNTIGRNLQLVPDSVIAELIAGYRGCAAMLEREGIPIRLSGGETADLGDLVRTAVIDSTLFARGKRAGLVTFDRAGAGDLIVGFRSTGAWSYDSVPNSGLGSNGVTLARHALLNRRYGEKYAEIRNEAVADEHRYRGPFAISDTPTELGGMTVGEALLSPTRSYAPLTRDLARALGGDLHGLVHCTGGGQTKILRFGSGCHFIKDKLFPEPGIFTLIERHGAVPRKEMFQVFNMGQRLEAVVAPERAADAIGAAARYGIEAAVIGRVESSGGANRLTIVDGDLRHEFAV